MYLKVLLASNLVWKQRFHFWAEVVCRSLWTFSDKQGSIKRSLLLYRRKVSRMTMNADEINGRVRSIRGTRI